MISNIHFDHGIPSRTPSRWTIYFCAVAMLLLGMAANGFSEGETKNKWVEEWPRSAKGIPVVRLYSQGRIIKEIVGHEDDKITQVPINEIEDKHLRALVAKEGLKVYRTEQTGTTLYPLFDGDLLLVEKTHFKLAPFPKTTKPEHNRMFSNWNEEPPESAWTTLTLLDNEGKTLWTKTLKPLIRVDTRTEDDKRIVSAHQEDPNQWFDFDLEGNLIGVRPAKDDE
ncbi:MAG: hypothetical protein LHV69_08835 [Elusimicrobia bacterium]|nr:hypothetical protein [Candidatus Obscuribacterium magneticum]